MRKLLLVLLAAAVLIGGWYAASPWIALNGLRDAAVKMDRAELEDRIDFAAVRESLKPQLRALITREIERQGDLSGLKGFAGAFALGMSDRFLDTALTPEGLAAIATTGAVASPLLPESRIGQASDWSVERDGFDRFRAIGMLEDGSRAVTLVFRRDGLSWDLTGIEFPPARP